MLLESFYEGKEQLQRDEAMRSCWIAGQTIMLAAKSMGYDSCPMIGFDQVKVAEVRHQHDLRNLRLGIVVLMTTSWPQIRNNMPAVATAIAEVKTGGLVEVPFDVQ
jgi:nitroreductase